MTLLFFTKKYSERGEKNKIFCEQELIYFKTITAVGLEFVRFDCSLFTHTTYNIIPIVVVDHRSSYITDSLRSADFIQQ